LNDDRLSYKNTGVDAAFIGLKQVGGFFGGDIAFAQESGPDGVRLLQGYGDGKLTSVKMFDGSDALLEISPFSEHVPLSFENDVLISGRMNLTKFGVNMAVLDGQLQSLDQSFDYSSIGFTEISKNLQISIAADGGSKFNVSYSPIDGFDIAIKNDSIVLEDFINRSPSTSLTEVVNQGIQNLGVYRDPDIIGIYPNDPVIIDYTDTQIASGLIGILTPSKGVLGTIATGQLLEGSMKLVVYGQDDGVTKTPTSWQIAIWAPTGEKDPTTRWPLYGWRILSAEEAKRHPLAIAHGLRFDEELLQQFKELTSDENEGSN